MSTSPRRSAAPAADRLSPDALRRVLARRRRGAASSPAGDGVRDTASPGAASPAPRPTPLRRWSVAELIANALAAPTSGQLRN